MSSLANHSFQKVQNSVSKWFPNTSKMDCLTFAKHDGINFIMFNT